MFCPGGMIDTVLYNTKCAKKENYLKIQIYKMHCFFFLMFLEDMLNSAFKIDEVSRWEKKKGVVCQSLNGSSPIECIENSSDDLLLSRPVIVGYKMLFHSRWMVKSSKLHSFRNERIASRNRRPYRLIRSTVTSVTSWLHLSKCSKIQPFCSWHSQLC